MSGRTADARPYPAKTSFFGEPQRSDHHPDRILSALFAASAAPSMTPSDMAPAPSTWVRNSGSSGYTISLAMSVKKLTHPISQMGRERGDLIKVPKCRGATVRAHYIAIIAGE